MPYEALQYPPGVYPGEAEAECPEAVAILLVLIRAMEAHGPSPPGYSIKNLGKNKGGLWQVNLKVKQRQVRVLYAPYGQRIVLFRIHKKSSPAEQNNAYGLAMKRKAEYEANVKALETGKSHVGNSTLH